MSPKTSRPRLVGLCPLCAKWFALKLDGRLQTHGPYAGLKVESQKHHDQVPLSIDDRMTHDSKRGKHERGRTLPPQ